MSVVSMYASKSCRYAAVNANANLITLSRSSQALNEDALDVDLGAARVLRSSSVAVDPAQRLLDITGIGLADIPVVQRLRVVSRWRNSVVNAGYKVEQVVAVKSKRCGVVLAGEKQGYGDIRGGIALKR